MAKEEKRPSHKVRSAAARAAVADMVGSYPTKLIVEQVSTKFDVGKAAVNDMVRSQRKREGIHFPLPKSRKHETNFAARAKVEVALAPAEVEAEDV